MPSMINTGKRWCIEKPTNVLIISSPPYVGSGGVPDDETWYDGEPTMQYTGKRWCINKPTNMLMIPAPPYLGSGGVLDDETLNLKRRSAAGEAELNPQAMQPSRLMERLAEEAEETDPRPHEPVEYRESKQNRIRDGEAVSSSWRCHMKLKTAISLR